MIDRGKQSVDTDSSSESDMETSEEVTRDRNKRDDSQQKEELNIGKKAQRKHNGREQLLHRKRKKKVFMYFETNF